MQAGDLLTGHQPDHQGRRPDGGDLRQRVRPIPRLRPVRSCSLQRFTAQDLSYLKLSCDKLSCTQAIGEIEPAVPYLLYCGSTLSVVPQTRLLSLYKCKTRSLRIQFLWRKAMDPARGWM